ncbi:MAG: EAL domain-containing protein [Alphaproteobacteria bacterium]|nr:EAL domain-containing protein [Alphaproteobacteria bacterium]
MSNQLDTLTKYPGLWLGVYACGSLMTIATVGQIFGGIAAGSATAFFILAGTFGFETMTRRTVETKLNRRVETLGAQQSQMTREIARTRNDVDALKDDMVQTAITLQKELKKFNALTDTPAQESEQVVKPPSSAMGAVQRSFQKMGNRLRPTSNPPSVAAFMPKQEPANEPAPKEPVTKESKIRKYRDILMTSESKPSARKSEPDLVPERPLDEVPEYSKAVLSELINHAVQNDKIEIFAQPIVRLPSRKISYLELFARIRARAGIYLPADTYRSLAEEESSIENVDHLLLLHTIDTIRADARRGVSIGYFINVCAQSFKNQRYMTDLLEFLRAKRDLAGHLVFEIQYKEYATLPPQLIRIIDGLSRLGCKFSIDNLTSLDFDDDRLAESGVNFLKLGSQTLVDLCKTSDGEMDLARLKSRLDNSGLELIVEKFETESALLELLDFEIDYGEGYLFGKPDLEMAYRKHVA